MIVGSFLCKSFGWIIVGRGVAKDITDRRRIHAIYIRGAAKKVFFRGETTKREGVKVRPLRKNNFF